MSPLPTTRSRTILPIQFADHREDYDFNDGIIDDGEYRLITFHSQCLIIESCYDSKILQEWLNKQPHVLRRLRSQGLPKYKLPQPGPYRPVAAFMPGEIDWCLLGEKRRFGRTSVHTPYGVAKHANGQLYSTYPGVRLVLTKGPVVVVERPPNGSEGRPTIKAIVQEQNLSQKQELWSTQRTALKGEANRICSPASSTALGKRRTSSRRSHLA